MTLVTRGTRLLLWLAILGNVAGVFATRYLPYTDLPEQVASMATIARLWQGEDLPYRVAFGTSQYLVYHVVGAALTLVVRDGVIANKLMMAAVAVAWPLSFRALLRALGRDERLAVFSVMPFWCRPLVLGFLPFMASIPLALFGLALLVRTSIEPSVRRWAMFSVVALVLFYTHVSSFVFFGAVSAVWTATFVHHRWREARRRAALGEDSFDPADASTWRAVLSPVLAFVPGVVAAAFWVHAGSLAKESSVDALVSRMPVGVALHVMPLWTFDIWTAHVDEACAIVWWSAFAVLVVLGVRASAARASAAHASEPSAEAASHAGWQTGPFPPIVPFAVVLAIYLCTPYRVGAAGMLNVRLATVLTIFAVLPLQLGRQRIGRWIPMVVAALSVLASCNSIFEIRRVHRETAEDLDVILEPLRPGTNVAILNFRKASPRMHDWPYVFAASYHRARAGAVASWSFSELPHWPVHYVPGREPPARGAFWNMNPCAYRFVEDGAYYDYVLVQGERNPFARDVPGPVFAPIARVGRFTLFEKRFGPPRDEPDRSVCAPSAPRPSEDSAGDVP